MAQSLDKFKETFREEAYELLTHLEDHLLELESEPLNGELINAAFRAIHTVKGSAAMFGFDSVSKFAHEMETALDLCRNGTLSITKEFIGLALKGRDQLRQLMEFEGSLPQDIAEESESLLKRFKEFADKGRAPAAAEERAPSAAQAAAEERAPAQEPSAKGSQEQAPTAAEPVPEEQRPQTRSYRIAFRPQAGIFKNGTKVLNLVEELAALGRADVIPHLEALPKLAELDPESCYVWWEMLLTTEADENAIRDIFIFVEDLSELKIETIKGSAGEGNPRLGEILIDRGDVSRSDVRDALGSQRKLGEVLVENKLVSKPQIEAALVEQEHLKKAQEHGSESNSIRVASDKLDALVDLVGELVTLQARLTQTSLDLKDGGLSSVAEQFERLISQLRDNAMSIRMLPIGSTFNKFRRVVRDLSLELGKETELVTEGAETELDKTVIEKLGDPLVHIIRNSVDHGIEKPELRERTGKNRKGIIRLVARHSGAYVLIQVSDDGKGLDRDAIRAKAIEKGFIAPTQEIADSELYNLIFEPGFSTAKVVTQVSGRGVGMDVVKREIDSLGGTAQLSTVPGNGMTVTLKIPLTLAIIEGLLVRIGHEFFVVPLSSVDGCIEIPTEKLYSMGERRIISYRDEIVPFIHMREFFAFGEGDGETEAEPEIEQIVIASAQDHRVGLVVDQVIGDYQTVIKPLGRMYRDVDGVSGATILGDGTVALILDVNRLAAVVQRNSGLKAAAGGA
jgi:Chemotaxis protein histidine kinase and related kinases